MDKNYRDLFIEKVSEKYNNKFDYSKFNYVNAKTPSIIIYPIHGQFELSPDNHLKSKRGCGECFSNYRKIMNIGKSHESKKKITKEEYLNRLKYKYKEKFEFNLKNYKDITNGEVILICEKHGLFEKRANKHLSGQGCFKCRVDKLIEENSLTGGYNEGVFNKNHKLKESMGYIYYIEINDGEYYKVGITRHLKDRLKTIKSESKMKIKLIDSLEINLYESYKLEQYILNTYKEHRVSLSWSTELFNKNVLAENKLNIISNKYTNEH